MTRTRKTKNIKPKDSVVQLNVNTIFEGLKRILSGDQSETAVPLSIWYLVGELGYDGRSVKECQSSGEVLAVEHSQDSKSVSDRESLYLSQMDVGTVGRREVYALVGGYRTFFGEFNNLKRGRKIEIVQSETVRKILQGESQRDSLESTLNKRFYMTLREFNYKYHDLRGSAEQD